MTTGIHGFRGEYRWLSNFALFPEPADTMYGPVTSVEAFYQASKCSTVEEAQAIASMSPSGAKKAGKSCNLISYWDTIKDDVMWEGLQMKFSFPAYAEKLIATGDLYIEETNWWGDTYWGVCRGSGQNRLGEMLMEIRGLIEIAERREK